MPLRERTICRHKRVDQRLVLLEHAGEELRFRDVLQDIVLLKRIVHDLAKELEYLRLHVGARDLYRLVAILFSRSGSL